MNSVAFRPTVLYVENNPDDLLLFQIACRKVQPSFALERVESVLEAKNYLQGQGQFSDRQLGSVPPVVLLDYSFDGEVGTELLRWAKGDTTLKNLNVIMFSGEEDPEIVQECYRRGANYFISKTPVPKDLFEFVRCLDQCLSTSPPCFDGLLTLKQYQFSRRMSGGVGC